MLQRRQQVLHHRELRRHADRRGDYIVGTLSQIHMVVGMHPGLAHRRGQIGDDLIGIHVGRRAGAGLVDVDREMRVVFAGCDPQRCRPDRLGHALWQQSQPDIDLGGRGFDQAQRTDEAARHRLSGDGEVLHGALRLCPPQCLGGYAQLAHAVVFDTKWIAHAGLRCQISLHRLPACAVSPSRVSAHDDTGCSEGYARNV